MTGERWLPIPSWEDLYEVSDHGNVRSVDRVLISRRYRGKVLKPDMSTGYPEAWLSAPGRPRRRWKISRLVLLAFVGPAPEGEECCHGNGDSTDSRLVNLRWDTHSSNTLDEVSHGTHWFAAKERCPRGHLLIEPNLVRALAAAGKRSCKACHRARSAAQYAGCPFSQAIADSRYGAIMLGVSLRHLGSIW